MISIALASYNGFKYIREQLDSILLQSYQNFELIICDDCSTGNTWQILEEYAKKDSRIKIYRNATNLGFKKNFEKAISLCTGDYIALCDQDDIWCNNHLEVLLSNIKGNSASVGNASIIDGEGRPLNYYLSSGDNYFYSGDNIDTLYSILCYRNPFSGAMSMYTRELIQKALPIPDTVKYHDVWFSVLACCLDGLHYTFEPLSKHRIHGNNESGSHHITLIQQILSVFNNNRKSFSQQRISLCKELLIRLPNIDPMVKNVILSVITYHENRFYGRRLRTISFMRNNYKRIFSTNNYKQFIPRCIGILISG